jgi:Membrane protein involved in the export of O-antigen and teichoic acid
VKAHAKNIVSLFGFDAIVRLLGFVSITYLARVLGNGPFGIINLGLAVFSYGLIVSSPGLHTIGTRVVSQRSINDAAIVTHVTMLRFMLALIACIVMTISSFFLVHDRTTRLVVILYSASLLPFAFQIEWFFQGKQRVDILGASRVIALLFFVVLLFCFVKSESDLLLVPVAYFANAVLNAAILFSVYWKGKKDVSAINSIPPMSLGWKSLLRQSLPVGAASIFSQAVFNLPVILLGVFATSFAIGNFSVASKLIFFLLSIDRAIYILFYPLVARTIATKPAELGKQVSRILSYLLIASLPICIGGLVLARAVVTLVFGSQYEDSAPLLQILLFYFLFTILNSIFAYVVIAAGRERRYSAIMVTISSLLLVALVPLTYYWKATGASYGLVAGEFLMMLFIYRECRKSIPRDLAFSPTKPIICSAVMGGILLGIPHAGLFLSFAVGIGSYFAGMVLLKGIKKDDILFLKERLI